MNLKIGLYAFCAQQMLMDRNTCVITIIKDICVSKCGRNFLKTRRYDSVLSPLFLFFNLIKTVAKFMRTESVKCPAHAVSQARAYYVTQFTYKSEKPTDLNYSISRVSYVHSSRTTDESLHFSFFLQKTKTLSLALPTSNSSLYCIQEMKPLDISCDQIFCKDIHKTLKYVDEFPE